MKGKGTLVVIPEGNLRLCLLLLLRGQVQRQPQIPCGDDNKDCLRGYWDSIQDFGEALAFAGGGGLLVVGVAGDEGQGEGGFREDHLLVGEVDLAPGAGFLEGGAGEGSVAGVGDGDLDGVLVHGGFDAEDVGGDDDVLREVLGDAAADHEQAGGGVVDLEFGDLVEVLGGVDGDDRLALTGVLVGDEAEAGGAVGEGGAEDGDAFLFVAARTMESGLPASGVRPLVYEVLAHGLDELAGGVGAGLERVGDLAGGVVADAELLPRR